MFEVPALLGVLALWGALGLVPWFVALVAGRGRLAVATAPLAFVAGIVAGALVPALGAKGWLGFDVSLGAALLAGAIASAATSNVLRAGVRA